LPSILFFSFSAPLESPHPYSSPPGSGVPSSRNVSVSCLFLFVFQSNSDPPNHQRLGAVHLFVTPIHSFVNPILVRRTDLSILRTLESSQYPFLPPSRLSTKHLVTIILTQTTAPNSRSLLIHQLLGVTLVVAAVSLRQISNRRFRLSPPTRQKDTPPRSFSFFNSLLFCTPFRRSISPLSISHGVGLSYDSTSTMDILSHKQPPKGLIYHFDLSPWEVIRPYQFICAFHL
jgi:hypothetical protein